MGTTITLTGTGLGGATSVSFNGTATASFNVTSSTSMTAVVPNGATTGNVVVTTGGGASNGVMFTVQPPAPVVSSLSPTSGPAGTVVTVTGTNLTGTTTLTLDGFGITGFTVVNGTTLTFTVPAGSIPGAGPVVVSTPSGNSPGVTFTVTLATATAQASQGEFSVWPNPVAGQGTLHLALTAAAASTQATLRNVLGQTVATRTFSGSTTELSLAGLASGTYLLTVQTEGRAPSTRRVVVE